MRIDRGASTLDDIHESHGLSKEAVTVVWSKTACICHMGCLVATPCQEQSLSRSGGTSSAFTWGPPMLR